jgi:hypothetical protein
MHVAVAVHVGAGIEQDADAVELTLRRCEVERVGIVAFIAGVRIGAVLEQNTKRVGVRHGKMKTGLPRSDPFARQRGFAGEKRPQRADAASATGLHERGHVRRPPPIDLGCQR